MGHTRYYYVYNMFYFSRQQDIPCTIMYIACFISVVNRTYQVPLCIQHVLFQYSIGHTQVLFYLYNMFYFSSQQDILGTIMYIACFISVFNRIYQVLFYVYYMFYISSQQDILGTIMYITCFYFSSQWDILGTIIYITCFISVVNEDILGTIMYIICFISVFNGTYQVLLYIQHVLFQQSIGDILGTIMYITYFISVVNRTYQVLLCI